MRFHGNFAVKRHSAKNHGLPGTLLNVIVIVNIKALVVKSAHVPQTVSRKVRHYDKTIALNSLPCIVYQAAKIA
jgi:hypothetical protein